MYQESGVIYFSTARQKEAEINLVVAKLDNAKDLLDLYKAGHFPPVIETKRNNAFTYPLKIGDAGTLPSNFFKVVQVIGKEKLLGEMQFSYEVQTAQGLQVIRDFKSFDFLVIIKGVDTSGIVDNTAIEITKILKVGATETYPTAAGTKTVFVLEPFQENKPKANQAEIDKKNAEILARAKEIKLKRLALEAEEQKGAQKEKATAAATQARDSIAKLIRGLASYEQRYEDSFKESKESVMDQMQDQAKTYIQGADKRLDAAIKEMEAAKIPEDERIKLVTDAKAAIAKAKKKVGIK